MSVESRHFAELFKTFRISKTDAMHGHLQGKGQVERTNRALIGLLKAFTMEAQSGDWDLSLGQEYVQRVV